MTTLLPLSLALTLLAQNLWLLLCRYRDTDWAQRWEAMASRENALVVQCNTLMQKLEYERLSHASVRVESDKLRGRIECLETELADCKRDRKDLIGGP
jgi:hypothetical protein